MPVAVSDLPSYLLGALPASRVKNHVQTLLFIQLSTQGATDFHFELAMCENVTASRRFSATEGKWSKWTDQAHAGFDEAWAWMINEINTLASRGYRCVTNTPLLLPLNETDVRHLREQPVLPRHSLEYGNQLYESIRDYVKAGHEKARSLLTGSGTTMPAPATPPVPPAASSSIADLLSDMDKIQKEIEEAVADRGAGS